MIGKLGPEEYKRHAKRAMDFLGWTEDKRLTRPDEDSFNKIVFAMARSERNSESPVKAPDPLWIKDAIKKAFKVVQVDNTPIEVRLLKAIHATPIGWMATPQYKLGRYTIDIAFPPVRLAIECDGRDYHTSPAQREHDNRRDDYMARLGWRVKRFRGKDIVNSVQACVDVTLAEFKAVSGSAPQHSSTT